MPKCKKKKKYKKKNPRRRYMETNNYALKQYPQKHKKSRTNNKEHKVKLVDHPIIISVHFSWMLVYMSQKNEYKRRERWTNEPTNPCAII